jgi:hypothetical protein
MRKRMIASLGVVGMLVAAAPVLVPAQTPAGKQ